MIIAEIGTDMTGFPTPRHLVSWAGLCPGHDESAGKRRSGHTRKGSKWLRIALLEAALAATHSNDTYLAAQYRRLKGRRGHRRASIAVCHSILAAAWHMLQTGEVYRDAGGDYFTRLNPELQTRRLIRQLENLGHHVTLNDQPAAALTKLYFPIRRGGSPAARRAAGIRGSIGSAPRWLRGTRAPVYPARRAGSATTRSAYPDRALTNASTNGQIGTTRSPCARASSSAPATRAEPRPLRWRSGSTSVWRNARARRCRGRGRRSRRHASRPAEARSGARPGGRRP